MLGSGYCIRFWLTRLFHLEATLIYHLKHIRSAPFYSVRGIFHQVEHAVDFLAEFSFVGEVVYFLKPLECGARKTFKVHTGQPWHAPPTRRNNGATLVKRSGEHAAVGEIRLHFSEGLHLGRSVYTVPHPCTGFKFEAYCVYSGF